MICQHCRRQITTTPMRRAVLYWVVRGESNEEIATRLNRGIGTIKTHIGALLTTFGAKNRTELAAIGARFLEGPAGGGQQHRLSDRGYPVSTRSAA